MCKYNQILLLAGAFSSPFMAISSTPELDSTINYKHEIGLDVSPATSVFVGNTGSVVYFSPIYKTRFFADHTRLRIHPTIIVDNGNSYERFPETGYGSTYYDENQLTNYSVISHEPTYQIRRYHVSSHDPVFRLGIGAEREINKGRVRWFFGAELFGSYSQYNYQERDYRMNVAKDSSGNFDYYYPDFTSSDTKTVLNTNSTDIGVGIYTTAGIRVHLNRRFVLTGELHPEFSVHFVDSRTRYANSSEEHFSYNHSDFDMSTSGSPIVALNLVYCFGKK